MALLECPTRNDLPSYNYPIKLDGVVYILSFYFNPRINDGQGKWFVSVSDQNNNLLAAEVPVVATWPLFDRFVDLSLFPGMLMCFDTSGANEDPGQFDLGNRCRILYLETGS